MKDTLNRIKSIFFGEYVENKIDNVMKKSKITINDLDLNAYRIINGIYVHKDITEEKLSTPIYRYMAFNHLLSMLSNKQLYVANRSTFSDSTEQGYMRNLKNELPLSVVLRSKNKTKLSSKKLMEKRNSAYKICISCWTKDIHTYGDESFLMWKCYAKEKVYCRIKTTIQDLINSISSVNLGYDILLSEVNYISTDNKFIGNNIQNYLFRKPTAYMGEQEIRLCVLTENDFILLNIDPFTAIKEVLISPFIDKDLSAILINHLETRFPLKNIPIRKSSIIEKY